MYRAFVRRQILDAFDALSQGDAPSLLARMSPDVHHTFPGTHALGGTRTNLDDVTAWFDRLFRILPGLRFEVHTIAVDGGPLDTRVGVEWTNTGRLLDGTHYRNQGAHILRLGRGQIRSFHAYLHDASALNDALQRLAAAGIEEAGTSPIDTRPQPG